MGLTLSVPPGFSDLDDAVLVAGMPALGVELAKIYENSAFGMVQVETFVTVHAPGDTVPLPISPIDGYVYSREELIYVWHIQRSTNFQTGWKSGGSDDSLWFAAWKVDQATGVVYSDEWYRRSGNHYNATHTNDGVLKVFAVGQRQRTHLIVASAPTYSGISGGTVAQDKPLTQLLAQSLNDNAKFSALNGEVFYLGEYYDGQTVTMPTSPADGYHYGAAECKFIFSWRWTCDRTTYAQPPISYGQMNTMKAGVNSSGVVSCSVSYSTTGSPTTYTTHGRIAVFAFCQRSGTPGSISPQALNFAELDFGFFLPGSTLPFGLLSQINANIEEAVLTPEYFGPTTYGNGATIPVPTSPIDGYTYQRSELTYIYDWSDTTNQTPGNSMRLPLFYGGVDVNGINNGLVTLSVWDLPAGGPYIDPNNSLCRISVLVVARRAAQHQAIVDVSTDVTPGSGSTTTDPVDVPTVSGFGYDVFTGDGSTTAFTLSQTPAVSFAMVFWNAGGGIVLPTDYSLSGTTLTTSFKTAGGVSQPADIGDKIYVVYPI